MPVGQHSGFRFSEGNNKHSSFTMPPLRESANERKVTSLKKITASSSDQKSEQKHDERKSPEHKLDHQEKSDHKEKSSHSYLSHEKQITFTIKPRKLVEATVLVLMFVAVFYLGRFSADPASLTGFASLFTFDLGNDAVDAADAPKAKEAAAAPKDDSDPIVEENDDSEEVVEETVDTSDEDVAEETDDSSDEDITTSYTKVTFTAGNVDFTWKETWGKITHVGFTLVNKEDAAVKIDHLGLMVEGYGDFEKKVPISSSIQVVDSMKQLQALAPVPSGFPYNAVTTGDLADVTVTLIAYDADGKEIATASTTANLQG